MMRSLSRFLAWVLALVLATASVSPAAWAASSRMTGDYPQDTLSVVSALREAIDKPSNGPENAQNRADSRLLINDFVARYRRDRNVSGLPSFTTMQTALNSLAGHYSSFPNRPLPEKLKARLTKEFRQVESALKRGA